MWDPRRLTPRYMDTFTLCVTSSLALQRCVVLGFLHGFITAIFSKVGSLAHVQPQPEDQGLHFAWALLFDLSGMGDHSSSLHSRPHSYPGHCGVRVYTKQTNPIELSPSWETTSRSATQEFPNFYATRKFISVHKNPPLVRILSQMNPAHTTTPVCKIHLNIILPLCLCLPSGVFPSGFPSKTLYAFRLALMHAT
jgi:hypothetical protein